MADSDKDILITPQTGAATDPSIVFSSGATGGDDVTLFVTDDGTITTLSIEGSAGQLLAISNDLTGTIFSVNDISGIPSIEVDADGTISLAEFDGEVGIGTAAPTEMLHIEGRDVASSNAGIRVNARGDAYLKLYADTVSDTELENAYIYMSQDADAVISVIGTIGGANVDPQNNTFTGSGNNGLAIHHKYATGTVDIGVNGQVGLTIDDSNNVTVKNGGAFTGDGSGLTTLTAANVSAGNLATGVLPYANTGGSSAYRLALLDTTGNLAGNYGLITSGSGANYNPSTETLSAVNASFDDAIIPILATNDTFNMTGTQSLAATGSITSTVNSNNGIEAGYLGVNSTSGSDGHGLSLYDGYVDGEPTYGIMFAQTATFGSYGNATGDWNTYFTMNSTADRGWSFKVSAGSVVASIENTGYANFPRYYVGSSTTHYMAPVTGQYGSVAVFGENTSYRGYAVGAGDIVLMSNGTTHGLYDDVNNDWWVQMSENLGVRLYHNGSEKLETQSDGIDVTGLVDVSGNVNVGGSMIVEGTGGDTFSIRHNGTDAFIENLGTRYIDIELTSIVEARVRDSDVAGTTSGMQLKDHGQVLRDAGFNDLRLVADNPASVAVLEQHMGGVIYADDNTGFTVTLPTSTNSFPVGGVITIINANTSGNITVSDPGASYTLFYLDGTTRTDVVTSCTVGPGGVATVWRQASTGSTTPCFLIWGSGITP
jgi:hypothetical protein